MGSNGKKWLAAGLAALVCCAAPTGTIRVFGEEESVSQNGIEAETEEQDLQDSAGVKTEEQILQNSVEPEAAGPAAQNEIMLTALDSAGIGIRYQGTDFKGTLGGEIAYDTYIGSSGGHELMVTVDGDSLEAAVYCIISSPTDSVTEDVLKSQSDWNAIPQPGLQISLDGQKDGKYVVGVKVTQGEEEVYAVSKGFVVDRTAPVIRTKSGTEMTDGGVYPAGTVFQVEDDSPVDVYMNDDFTAPVEAADGRYTVTPKAGSNSCVIKAEDKAGNVKSLSLTIEGGGTDVGPAGVIAESKSYSLQSDTAYTLGEGAWRVAGDPNVYPGGITFYVTTAGGYAFQKQ